MSKEKATFLHKLHSNNKISNFYLRRKARLGPRTARLRRKARIDPRIARRTNRILTAKFQYSTCAKRDWVSALRTAVRRAWVRALRGAKPFRFFYVLAEKKAAILLPNANFCGIIIMVYYVLYKIYMQRSIFNHVAFE